LRDNHRWAAFVCTVDGNRRLCAARDAGPQAGTTPSPVRGVWDGFVMRVASPVAAVTEIDLPAGRYRISLRAEGTGVPPTEADAPGAVVLSAGGGDIARAALPAPGASTTLAGVTQHPGGTLRVRVDAIANSDKSAHENAVSPDAAASVLMSMFAVEVDRP